MAMTRAERVNLHKKQERLQVRSGVPSVSDLVEGVPVIRSTPEGMVEYVRHNMELFERLLDRSDGPTVSIDNYTITWSANEPTPGSANTIDDGDIVGNNNEAGQAIADLTAKVNDILNVLRSKNIIKV